MLLHPECIECIKKQRDRLAQRVNGDSAQLRSFIDESDRILSDHDVFQNNPPSVSSLIYEMARKIDPNTDFYEREKDESNREMSQLYDQLKAAIHDSEEPLRTALKISVNANAIDFAITNHDVNLTGIYDRLLMDSFVIDQSEYFFEQLGKANSLLYILDNVGEIIADKLLIETIKEHFPRIEITAVTRGKEVFNDVTVRDAETTGLSQICRVIDTGVPIPSIPERGNDEFETAFQSGDVILAKGQGNFETERKSERVFHLFQVKCNVVSGQLEIPLGGTVFYEKNKNR